jgi:hypothetical protein
MRQAPATPEQQMEARDALLRSLTVSDLHVIARSLYLLDDDELRAEGFSERMIQKNNALFERIDFALSAAIGSDWPTSEPL